MAAIREKNWDQVPDDELVETYLERLEGLKEMVPETIRKKVSSTIDWSFWAAKNTFTFTQSAIWIVSSTALVMVVPYLIEKELYDLDKTQVKHQKELLLGPAAMIDPNAQKK